MTRYLKPWAALLVAAFLTACGGGGGSPGATSTGGGVTPTDPTAVATASVADLAIYTDKSAMSNSGTDKVTVTVVAVNANRNAVTGATVTVSADKNSIFTAAGATTDATGTFTGTLTIGSDRTNRTITITAIANGISRQTTVQVADISGPGNTANAVADFALLTDKTSIANTGTDTAVLTVVAVDSNRNVVAGATVSVAAGANAIFTPNGTNVTNASGIFTGTISAGSDKTLRTIPITVTVNGIVKTTTLDVTFPVVPTTPSTPGGTTTTTTPVIPVADMVLFLDKSTINNSGSDKAQLTVIALDVNRNVVSGAAVAVTTDQNSVFIPTGGNTTNAQGTYTGNVSIGADKSNRVITLSVTINGIVRRTSVQVIGSKLTVQAQPSTLAPGQAGTISTVLQDSSLNPVAGTTITLSGSLPGVSGLTAVTDFSGQAKFSFTAPGTTGTFTIGAAGSGVTAASVQVQVVTAGVIPDAVIPAGVVPSLSASPNVLQVNAVGSTANRSTLRFLFVDGSGNPVTNVRVRFDDLTTGIAAVGSSITSGTQTLVTDNSGVVTAQYIAGQNSSPTNGVTIQACYNFTDPVPPLPCPAANSVKATLTVAGAALAVSIGDDNLLTPSNGTYIKKFAITVADSAGRAVANAPVDISLDLTHYGKSQTWGRGTLSTVPTSLTADATIAASGTATVFYWCQNEDTNRNGVVDPSENRDNSVDANGQPTLQPRRSDMIISYDDPTVTTTNASGILIIRVQYSQRYGGWLAYKVRVTANVAGSQGMAERPFVTDVLAADVTNGSFLTPAYGVNNCTTAN
ncbi:hypothetical protein ACFPOE_23005 [Caenimonas terrae]|uniref:Big-1 domain-containing protein n=1 Tax=Caenimonas terrae TaxID=696074 RepID=A0ABW0NJI2_9BURK